MTGFRAWAQAALGEEAGDHLADSYAAALGQALDTAVFYGTTPPIQENPMARSHKTWCVGEHLPTGACTRNLTTHPIQENDMKPMPRPEPLVHWSPPTGDVPHAIQAGVQAVVTTYPERVTCPSCQAALDAVKRAEEAAMAVEGYAVPQRFVAGVEGCTCREPYPNLPGPIENQCLRCGLTIPADRMAEARANAAPQARMSDCPSPLGTVCTDPTCLVHFGGLNEAERLGLVVGAAYGTALAERDQARALAVRLEQDLGYALEALEKAAAAWPETSWASDSQNKDRLVQAIQNLKALESPETPESSERDR